MLQKRQNDRLRRRLFVERLEDRTVLSGNVTASLDPVTGLLSIIGDASDNAIAISQGAKGTAIITGETKTAVNGAAAAGFDNVTGISVQFLDGNDRVKINSVVLPGALSITAGTGSDTITLGNSTLPQADITVATDTTGAQGNNCSVDIRNDAITGNASITTGNGYVLNVGQTVVGGLLSITMGDGGVNAFESLTLVDVTSADLVIKLSSNFGDNVNINLTNVAVTDPTLIFTFLMSDEGGNGGIDHVNMVNVQVTEGLLVHLSPSFAGPNDLFAANVTCAFGFVYPGRPDSTFIDGGGNVGWLWTGL